MFERVFNRRRRLGAEPIKEPCVSFDDRPPIPPDAEPIPVGDDEDELTQIARLIEFAPKGGWAYTNTGLYRVVEGLNRMP